MVKTIKIDGPRPLKVQAKVFGDWAVHAAVNDTQGSFAITHVPSGRTIARQVGWAVDDERAAIAVAKRLARAPGVPLRLAGETTFPYSEAKDWACFLESIAAEVLAELVSRC